MSSSTTARSAASARASPPGVVDTKLTIKNVIDQMDLQLAEKPEESPFYRPVLNFPARLSPRPTRRGCAPPISPRSRDDIYPVYARLRDFLRDDYLPKARDGFGLVHMKGGDKLYQRLHRKHDHRCDHARTRSMLSA